MESLTGDAHPIMEVVERCPTLALISVTSARSISAVRLLSVLIRSLARSLSIGTLRYFSKDSPTRFIRFTAPAAYRSTSSTRRPIRQRSRSRLIADRNPPNRQESRDQHPVKPLLVVRSVDRFGLFFLPSSRTRPARSR